MGFPRTPRSKRTILRWTGTDARRTEGREPHRSVRRGGRGEARFRRAQRTAFVQAAVHTGDRLGRGPRADVPSPRRLRRTLPVSRRPGGSAPAPGVRVRRHGHHPVPGAENGARARGPARSQQPAGARHPRWGRAPHRRQGGRPRRRSDHRRGGPRPGGRQDSLVREPVRGRVAPDRRIGPGPQERGGRGRRALEARRRRPAVRVLQHARRPGPGRRRGLRHGRPHRDRQDRKGPAAGRAGRYAAAEEHRTAGAKPGAGRALAVRRRRGRLRADPRELAGGPSGGDHPGDGDAARGAPRHSHDLPRAGRLAHLPQERADAARPGHRDARLGDGPVHRQDRNPDPEPDVGQPAVRGRRVPRRAARQAWIQSRRGFTSWSSSAFSPASGIPSTPWNGP